MATPIRIPSVGQTSSDVTLVSWLRATGDPVAAGDAVAVVETDKTELDVESPVDGTIGELRINEGDVLRPGALMVYVLRPGESEPQAAPVSPRAKKLAAELGVDLSGVVGSGPGGLVTERDVHDAAPVAPTMASTSVAATVAPVDAQRPVRARHALTPVRRAGARRLTESWTSAPHFVQMFDVDMTACRARRTDTVGYNELFVAALAAALAEHPALNAAFAGDELVEWADVNVGLAVDSPDGLVVPVVPNADRLGLDELAARIAGLTANAREGRLAPDDMRHGSATVSNLGAWGVVAGTAVLNRSEAVLLFVGAVSDRAVVRDGAIVVRPMATLSFAFDHRVVDGAPAAEFAKAVIARLEG